MMERGALGELIPETGHTDTISWETIKKSTLVWERGTGVKLARFWGEKAIRLERVALFLTTEQS